MQTKAKDIVAREAKIKSIEEKLEQKRKIKASIVTYIKEGKWVKPYPKCKLKVVSKKIKGFTGDSTPIEDFERSIEASIRSLKRCLAELKDALRQAKERMEKMKNGGIKRAMFGSKAFYRKKDNPGTDMKAWKKEFHDRRYHSMSLPGRHDGASCNFLAIYDPTKETLTVKCMDGKDTVFHDFRLARYHDIFLKKFGRRPEDREPICYNFTVETDKKGRTYVIPSVTMNLSAGNRNSGFSTGCVAIDLNVDRIAVSDLDEKGNRLKSFDVPLDLKGKSSGAITDAIGRAMSVVGKFCEDRKKCLVMEDIDLQKKKSGLRYGNKKTNRKVSQFAYKKMTASALAQGFKRNFTVYKVNPAYTSMIGKICYMRKMGISIHQAASYVIGLRAMGLDALCAPPTDIVELLPENIRSGNVLTQCRYIYKAISGVRTHAFYRIIKEDDWKGRKKHGFKNYIAILKNKDQQKVEQK